MEVWTNPGWRLRGLWIGLAAVLFYLHYTAALLIAAEVVCFLWMCCSAGREAGYRPAALPLDLALVVVLCLPAASHLTETFQRRAQWDSFIPLAPWQDLFQWWPLALGSLFLIAAILTERCARSQGARGDHEDKPINGMRVLGLCWLLVPAAITFLLTASGTARLFYPRYLAASAVAVPLVGGLTVMLAPWRATRHWLGWSLLGVCLWSSGIVDQWRTDGRFIGDRQEDWRAAVAWLNQQLADQQGPVLVYSGLIEAEGLKQPHAPLLADYCLLPVTALYPIAAERGDLVPLPLHEPGRLTDPQRGQVESQSRVWLVTRTSDAAAGQIAQQIIAELRRGNSAAAWRVRQHESFGAVQVLRIAP